MPNPQRVANAPEPVHDDKIYDEVREHLERAEGPLRSVHVDVEAGVVTLRGSVETHVEQQLAVELARSTHGVHEVRDQLRVSTSLLEQLKSAISYVL